MEKVYGYVRVSTETQAKSGYGAAAQKHAIIDYCTNNNLELVEIFEDLGITSTTIEREGLTQLTCSCLSKSKNRLKETLVIQVLVNKN